jgi:hypothetical protein
MSLQDEVNRIINNLENPDGTTVPVTFYDKAVYNEAESKAKGRPVYENRVFVRKNKDNLSVYESIARDDDFRQFPKQYELFLARRQQRESGIPLASLPNISPSEIATCEACRIYTIEKLAEAPETIMLAINNPELKEMAIAYLKGESLKDKEIEDLRKKLEAYESINDGAKRGRRNAAIRAPNDSDKQRKQGSEAVAILHQEGMPRAS